MKIGVLGAGSFGTALAVHAARRSHETWLWARRSDQVQALSRDRENRKYLEGVEIPPEVSPTTDLEAVGRCDVVLVAVPSHGFRAVLHEFLEKAPGDRPTVIVSATKGIEPETLARMSQVSFEEGIKTDREVGFAVLSGPSFAIELAQGKPTAAVIASEDGSLARRLQEILSNAALRLYTSGDVAGVELGGTCKNVIAIAAGIVDGLGFGHNTQAALITRGLHEMTRLGLALGGQPRTFSGLAGLGDLVLTCTGGLSRNRRAGIALAQGKSLTQLEEETGMVAEGVRNSVAVTALAAKKGVEMPIAEQMVEVIHHGKPARKALEELMSRDLKAEAEL
ncbi:MAG TPA: NAD(P)H-dependent glycerol-3-phosphate dehydrogenase [Longimicrobiaceae bacterium]|nr:NAD(P)H-dependent glycerol-3-phosphate dehydrogenase [Longimicrobiaceae bacterium]